MSKKIDVNFVEGNHQNSFNFYVNFMDFVNLCTIETQPIKIY